MIQALPAAAFHAPFGSTESSAVTSLVGAFVHVSIPLGNRRPQRHCDCSSASGQKAFALQMNVLQVATIEASIEDLFTVSFFGKRKRKKRKEKKRKKKLQKGQFSLNVPGTTSLMVSAFVV